MGNKLFGGGSLDLQLRPDQLKPIPIITLSLGSENVISDEDVRQTWD